MPTTAAAQLDTATVVAVCQAISREHTLDELAATVVRLTLKVCGAYRVQLLLMARGELSVIARGATSPVFQVETPHSAPFPRDIPLTLIGSVKKSRRKVVIDNLAPPHPFGDDEYFAGKRHGCAASVAVLREDALLGVLYMEHDDTGAFGAESVALLEILAAQSAIALEQIQVTEKFKGLLESAPDAMVIIDEAGEIVMVNSQVERLFGYRKEELVGRDLLVLIPQRYRAAHAAHVGEYMATPHFRPMGRGLEFLGLRKDGTEFPVDISLSPFSSDGTTLVTAAIRDITDRKRAEEAVRLAEEKFRGIFQNAAEGIFCASPDGRLIEANRALARMLKYDSPAELMERITDLGVDLNLGTRQLASYSCAGDEKGVQRLEAQVPCKDGSIITVSACVAGVHDAAGTLLHYEAVVENITERKKAEEALRYSEARYRTLFRDNPTMIFIVDEQLKILSMNPFAAAKLGYSEDELEGKKMVEYFHEEDRDEVEAQLRRCLADTAKSHTWQFRKVCKDGKILWVEELGQAVYDLDGTLNVMVVCLDVTERRGAEMALKESERRYRQLSEHLEVRVKEAVDELRQKDKLLIAQSRQAVMGEMISNIAHQWRQPLNTLALLAQERHYFHAPGQVSKEVAEANFAKTMQTINHMSKTIDDFRNFFRPEKEKVPFKVRECIEKSLNLIEGSLKSSQIEVQVRCDEDPEVVGFPNEFSQVLVNIVINARDALASAGVAAPFVHIHLFREGERTVLTITDNAGGMPGWVLEKIFEPYFTTKGPDKGTGVGLFMCKTIIEKSMNGRLSASNVEGGAQFRIEL